MEDLPESLLAEIVKRITRRCDLNSLSLVSKQLYTIDANQKGTLRATCGHRLIEKHWYQCAPGSPICGKWKLITLVGHGAIGISWTTKVSF